MPTGMTEVLGPTVGAYSSPLGCTPRLSRREAAISGLGENREQTDLSEPGLLAAEVALATRRPVKPSGCHRRFLGVHRSGSAGMETTSRYAAPGPFRGRPRMARLHRTSPTR